MAQAIPSHFIPQRFWCPLLSAHHPMPLWRPHPTSQHNLYNPAVAGYRVLPPATKWAALGEPTLADTRELSDVLPAE